MSRAAWAPYLPIPFASAHDAAQNTQPDAPLRIVETLLVDALLLSRIQFGFVISFHILFPAFTIGLASWLAFVEFRWLRTREAVWRDLYFFCLEVLGV